MAKICPDCNDRGKVGRKPCPTCNPAGGLGDVAVSIGRRARNAVTGRTAETDGRTTTTRPHRLAPSTTTRATAPKPRTATRRSPKPKAVTPAEPQMPACDSCGKRGTLKVTRKGAVCSSGCAS